MSFACLTVLKSDLRGIETGFPTTTLEFGSLLKSDLRGIETLYEMP